MPEPMPEPVPGAVPEPTTATIVALPVTAVLGPGLDLLGTVLDAVTAALADRVRGDGPPGTTAPRGLLRDGDVLVVASKVVALAEGRLVPLPDPVDRDGTATRDDPRRALARRHARRIVADHPRVLVVETAHGLVCAQAGIDTSNVPDGHALLLPADPDASAARLRADLVRATGRDVGVVVTDTFGRPWREGQVDVAIGAAGISAVRDERGTTDLLGHDLHVTVAAVADELAGAADLVRGKATPVPFVLVRGLDLAGDGHAADLVRPAAQDLFPAGGPTLAEHAVTTRPSSTDAPDPAVVDHAVEVATAALPAGVVARLQPGAPVTVAFHGPRSDAALLAVGAAAEDLRILLAGHGAVVGPPRPGPSDRRASSSGDTDGDVLATLRLGEVPGNGPGPTTTSPVPDVTGNRGG